MMAGSQFLAVATPDDWTVNRRYRHEVVPLRRRF